MTDRREDDAVRTNRPNPGVRPHTVRDVLAEDAIVAGMPEVLVGGESLDVPVRWVHASDNPGVARLLNGGEIILSTGRGWDEDEQALRDFVVGLVEAKISALIIELGTHYRWVPAVVEQVAREHKLALIALHHEVKFVAVTEAVHHTLISRQTAALKARDDVRERFTALALRGSPADFIVHQLGATLGAGVVLENLSHDVVTAEVPPAQEVAVFADWQSRSRALTTDGADPDWLVVPVEARGRRWGRLIALPGPEHPAGRQAVLEQGAIALAVGRLADADTDEWSWLGRRRLLDSLLNGRFAGTQAAAARLAAAGVPTEDRRFYGMVVTGSAVRAERVDAVARETGGRALLGTGPRELPGSSSLLLSLPLTLTPDDAAFIACAVAFTIDPARAVISVGAPAYDLDEALASLQEASDIAHSERGTPVSRGPVVRRGDDRPLLRLVTAMRGDRRLQEHGERMLAPLIAYDLAKQGDLRQVLEAMLQHPTNRTAAAAASHLSRSVFYQRMTLIQDLLNVDLEDGEIQTALHVALLSRRASH